MTLKYFAYDGLDFHLFATQDEASDFARNLLDELREEACDGWDGESLHICWGKVCEHVVVTESRPVTPEDCLPPEISHFEERQLVSVDQGVTP